MSNILSEFKIDHTARIERNLWEAKLLNTQDSISSKTYYKPARQCGNSQMIMKNILDVTENRQVYCGRGMTTPLGYRLSEEEKEVFDQIREGLAQDYDVKLKAYQAACTVNESMGRLLSAFVTSTTLEELDCIYGLDNKEIIR